ncbi:MAG TPA: Mov34/MPN/PAD-1 family protein [Candidatus Angelobacter sp.]
MSSKSKKKDATVAVRISSRVLRRIRQHARSNSKTEVCGVLIGRDDDGATSIEACIAGINAAQGGAHVTFTQDTWEHIYKIKDREYPDERIVGWYHSHPGFGVFLSDHDTFIHRNFFSSAQQVAWVYDPHSDEEGCFGWVGDRLERLASFSIVDSNGGQSAGDTGQPETSLLDMDGAGAGDDQQGVGQQGVRDQAPSLTQLIATTLSYISVFLLGGVLAWYLFPRVALVPVPVDPYTGRPLINRPQDGPAANPGHTPASNANTGTKGKTEMQNPPGNGKGNDAGR